MSEGALSAAKLAQRQLRRDLVKLLCLTVALVSIAAIFFFTPVLSAPALLSVVLSLLLSPLVAAVERRGYSRGAAIGIVFSVTGMLVIGLGAFAIGSLVAEWDGFRENAPIYFHETLNKLTAFEQDLKNRYPFLESVRFSESLLVWGQETGKWFLSHGPALMGQILTVLLVAPLLTFALLNDGRVVQRKIYELVPNRFFESTFMMTWRILSSISDYIRAKLIEALIVGALTALGLLAVKAPYALVLGIMAGVTNIIPYAGPIIGAVPGFLIAAFDSSQSDLLFRISLVYVVANVIDMAVIFPLVVAKLVNLHPVILIVAVMLGQEYYGLIGMLISIPIATGLKIILQEVSAALDDRSAPESPKTKANPVS